MFIKICANTNLEDAQLAVELGADAVGFVCAPSTRRVNANQVRAITAELPPDVECIGVFSSLDGEEIAQAVTEAGLTGVQLHGGYSEALVRFLREEFGERLRIVQTNHWRVGGQVDYAFAEELRHLGKQDEIDAVLVDSRTAVADGGTGVAFDWQAAKASMKALGEKPLIVAGGLNAANVETAIEIFRPWGVDVASGVEAVPGKKDPERLRAFIEAARRAGSKLEL